MDRAPWHERSPQAHAQLRRVPHGRRRLDARRRVGRRPAATTVRVRPAIRARRCDQLHRQPGAREQFLPLARARSGCGRRAGVPAGVRPPRRLASRRPHARPSRPASPTPPARPRPDRSRIESNSRAAATSSASSPTPSTPCSRARGARRRAAEVCGQRVPRAAHPTRHHADAPRRRPQRSDGRHRASSSTASAPSTPGRSTSPKHCSCSAAPTNDPSLQSTSTSPSSRKKRLRHSFPWRRNAASPSRPPATRPRPSAPTRSCCR